MSRTTTLPRRKAIQATGTAFAGALAGCSQWFDGRPPTDESETQTDEGETQTDEGDIVEYSPYIKDANGYERTVDRRGEESVTIAVGAGEHGLAFDPAAVAVSPGTEVVWEWTGEGIGHNVISPDHRPLDLQSEIAQQEGHTYRVQIESRHRGVTTYFCHPHELGGRMKGAIVVAETDEDLAAFSTDVVTDETYGGWMADIDGYTEPLNRWSQDEVVVRVGACGGKWDQRQNLDEHAAGIRFDPMALRINPGTTIIWGWTGAGGAHEIETHDGTREFKSDQMSRWGEEFRMGFTREHVGVTKYQCNIHGDLGMRGVIQVVEK